MSLYNFLGFTAKRNVAKEISYPLLNFDDVLSKYTVCVQILASAVFTELSLFSQIEPGNVIFLKKGEIQITSLEICNQTLEVQSV